MWYMPANYLEGFFTPTFYVDSFQATKKIATNQIITDPILNQAAHNYIRAQTEFAKMLINNYINISKYVLDTNTKYWLPEQQTHTHKGDEHV